ncbi:Uncharacterised protein [Mycobacteroides abscessus subsp. abscessus]|uniref:hypothetical protein n=1 Tax=Mycobacteroides abscessus TaxID=36809 RepID=UPI00092A04A8|nr:hypothetical protein [Mycobacteroides abscessus]SIM03663.1 Uncharacterised protein [Mycobacteroides abscessus subsp. abscessus]SLC78164.1 Uncharacterised protein [Mycobacteroides abscessus subsp. abscessus]
MPQMTASGFDMSFLDNGRTAGVFSDVATATDTWNNQLSAHISELAQLADGATVSAAIDQLGQAREGLSAGGYALAASSAALAAQKAADDQWRKAPQDDEIESARQAVTEASKELAVADGQAAIAAEAKLKAAIDHARDLNERRKQADKDFVDSSGKAQERLREFNPGEGKNKKGKRKEDDESGHALPGKKPGTNNNSSPTPANRAAPAAPGRPAPAAPSTPSTASSGAGAASSSQDALSALLARTGQIPAAQVAPQPQQQQPQTAPAAAGGTPSLASSPVSTPKSKVEGAINADDIPGIAAPVPMPMGPAAGPAPAAVAPASQPTTSGNSAPNLSTDSNVSGRPEGARSAFNQPHTSASGATGMASGAGTGTSTGLNPKGMQAAGMPATGMPMTGMPMAPGAANGGRSGAVKPVQAHQDSNVYEEGVVRGGTIAQNRPDYDDKA